MMSTGEIWKVVPDLQALVKAHGYWCDIPPEAWAKFDAARAEWQAWARSGAKYVKGEHQRNAKPAREVASCTVRHSSPI
jgi:hypothetical protein